VVTKTISLFNSSVHDPANGIMAADIYPVPAKDVLHLKLETAGEQLITYKVYNVHGKLITEKNLGKINGLLNESIPTSGYSAGIYFIEIDNESGRISKRFAIE
jgi:hypothetical protein